MNRRVTLLVLVVMLAALLPAPSAQAQPPPPVAPAQPEPPPQPAQTPLDCSATPFGRSVVLGHENEIFVGMRGGSGGRAGWALNERIDLNSAGNALASQALWPAPSTTPDASFQSTNIGSLATTTGRFISGSDAAQLVQVYRGNDGGVRVAFHNPSGVLVGNLGPGAVQNYTLLQATVGVVTRATGRTEQLVIAGVTGSGALVATIVNPRGPDTPRAIWRTLSGGRNNPRAIDVTTADLNGDGFDDEIVLVVFKDNGQVELIVLRYEQGFLEGSGSEFKSNLREIAALTVNVTPNRIAIAAGDLDGRLSTGPGAGEGSGDYKDELVLLTDNFQSDIQPNSSQYTINTYTLNVIPATPTTQKVELLVVRGAPFLTSTAGLLTRDLDLAAGDVNGDGRAEIVVGIEQLQPTNELVVRVLDGATETPRELASSNQAITMATGLRLAVGDLEGDGSAETVAAFRNSANQIQVLALGLQGAPPSQSLTLRGNVASGADGRQSATSINLALGDWDDNSLKAVAGTPQGSSISCQTVQEPNLNSVVNSPPFWQRLQGNRVRRASIGESSSFGKTDERAVSINSSHAVSAYFGAGFEANMVVAKVGATARIVAGYQYTGSVTNRSGTTETTTIREAWTNEQGGFAALQRTTYDCYNYRLVQGNQELSGGMRFCEFKGSAETATDISRWNSAFGPAQNVDTLQWVPLNRDWANLALFRGAANVAQSSTQDGADPVRAADGVIDPVLAGNSVARTTNEAAPWWQIDLGRTHELGAVRVWNRNNSGCPDTSCARQLRDFYVFVSDVDPRTISNNPEVLKNDPRVRAFFNPGQAGRATNVQTFSGGSAVLGRYIRVQLAGSGNLSLAEVQAFSEGPVDPDRYPASVSPGPAGSGYFLVSLYNPNTGQLEQVRQRGRLLWNGAERGLLANRRVTVGNVVSEWSLINETNQTGSVAESIGHSVSIGAQFDAEVGGGGGKVIFGGGYEYTAGVVRETVRTTSWGKALEISGGVQGLPSSVAGVNLSPGQCEYGFQPYYYELTEEASGGFSHSFVVVDYTVIGLNRNASLELCRVPPLGEASLQSSVTSAAPGSSILFSGRGFPANSTVQVELQAPGAAGFRSLANLPTSAVGEVFFLLTTAGNDPLGTYTVRISSAGGNPAATASFALVQGGPVVNPPAPDVPVVPSKLRVFLPLVRR